MKICIFALGLLLGACISKPAELSKPDSLEAKQPSSGHVGLGAPDLATRVMMSRQECKHANGTEIGDIGDGRIHRLDYLCADGKPPLGVITSTKNEPIATEGSVCCANASE